MLFFSSLEESLLHSFLSFLSLSLSLSLSLLVYYNNNINKMEWYRTKFIKTGSFGPVKHAMVRSCSCCCSCCCSCFARCFSLVSSLSCHHLLPLKTLEEGFWKSIIPHDAPHRDDSSLDDDEETTTTMMISMISFVFFFSFLRRCAFETDTYNNTRTTTTTDWNVRGRLRVRTLHAP